MRRFKFSIASLMLAMIPIGLVASVWRAKTDPVVAWSAAEGDVFKRLLAGDGLSNEDATGLWNAMQRARKAAGHDRDKLQAHVDELEAYIAMHWPSIKWDGKYPPKQKPN